MIKYCVFDLDGTLLNTIDSISYYVNKTLQNHGVAPIAIEQVKAFVGDGAKNLVRRCLEYRGEYHSDDFICAMTAEYKTTYEEAPLYLTAPYDGIPELIGELRAKGIRLAVLSNKPDSAVRPILENFFPGAFDIVLGAGVGYPLKPDPSGLFKILDDFSAKCSEVAYFGDTSIDIKTGLAGGVAYTVGVLWGFRDKRELSDAGATILVERPSEILEVIR